MSVDDQPPIADRIESEPLADGTRMSPLFGWRIEGVGPVLDALDGIYLAQLSLST